MLPIKYDFNTDKFIAAMAYMADRVQDLTKLRACKLIYFSDKYHLLNFGRPIFGDQYAKMDYGPVPSQSCNYMNDILEAKEHNSQVEDYLIDILRHLGVKKKLWEKNPHFVAREPADLSVLSPSDIEALDHAIEDYGSMSIGELLECVHEEPSWINTQGHWIDYRKFFDLDNPDHRRLLQYAKEVNQNVNLFDEMALDLDFGNVQLHRRSP